MAKPKTSRFSLAFDRLQWGRGLRAGFAVGSIMLACQAFSKPVGWAALGALQVLMVDNGGPYRSRFDNILTALIGSAIALVLGTFAGHSLTTALVITALFCFAATFARVLSQPLAASSVAILVCYVVAYGGTVHTISAAANGAFFFILGGLWAAFFALILWPLDPFKPARNAVADIYADLTELVAAVPTHTTDRTHFTKLIAETRLHIEAAQAVLAATPARMTARTIRARNLSALVQTADLLFARTLRIAELSSHGATALTADTLSWLGASLAPVEPALRAQPADRASGFAPNGSLSTQLHRHASIAVSTELARHLATVERDCMLSLEVAYEAVRAIWTGAEPRLTRAALFRSQLIPHVASPLRDSLGEAFEAARANFTPRSIMFRHALRLTAVTTLNVLLLHLVHFSHGYWLAMTSVIVLQPYTGETLRRSGDRVAGTVAGALLAAILAALIPSQSVLLISISIGCVLTLASIAVDYAWYCFFLTPTVVLLTLPHLHDWRFAAVRMGMTLLGAVTALGAMLLFWPERETVQLPRLLSNAAAAEAAYLRAVLAFWSGASANAPQAERALIAPARRACGLASNDAEESLDRSLLEHSVLLRGKQVHETINQEALTFTTYLRRLTQSITTLAAIGSAQFSARVSVLASRLDVVASRLAESNSATKQADSVAGDDMSSPAPSLAAQQLSRMERQVGVLEQAATAIQAA